MALYSNTVVIKGFHSSRKLILAKIVTVKLKADLLLNAFLCICPLTYINEALHLSGSPSVASTTSSLFSLAGIYDVLC